MEKQEFILGTEKRMNGWYAVVRYPEEEGGSIEEAGPFPEEKDAKEKLEQVILLLKKIFWPKLKALNRIQ